MASQDVAKGDHRPKFKFTGSYKNESFLGKIPLKISAEPPLKIGLSQIYTYMENIILIYSVTTTNATGDPTIVYPQLKYT